MDLYSNPDLYDAIHINYTWDINLIKAVAKNNEGPVLELASGTGRLTQCILDLDLMYTGLDLSPDFIKRAKNKYDDRANFFFEDMRNFKLSKKFGFIFIGFNSFLHNLTLEEAKDCLKCVSNHLKKTGRFLISIFIPDPSFLFRNTDELFPASSFFDYHGTKCRILERNLYNPETQINALHWFLEKNGKLDEEKYSYNLRMYYPHEMDILLYESGLTIKEKFGDYDGSPMDEESGMQIYICGK